MGWLWLAAELGNIEALNAAGNLLTMGKVVPADHGTAYRYFRTAAEAGCPLCQGILGAIHAGFRPTKANTREAMRWLRLSAANGRADAALLLARRYRFGLGVPVDPREAALLPACRQRRRSGGLLRPGLPLPHGLRRQQGRG